MYFERMLAKHVSTLLKRSKVGKGAPKKITYTLVKDWGYQDCRAEEELPVCGRERRVVSKFPGQSAHDGITGVVGEVKEGVHVGKKLVADIHCCFTSVNDGRPDICFLRVGGESIVIPIEGEKGRELHPAIAELFVSVSVEAAGVNAEHRDAEKTECQGLRNAEEHVCEEACVIAAPVTSPFTGARERRASNNKGPFAGDSRHKSVVCGVEDLVAKEVVDIVLLRAIVVSSIW